jgi:hypothetical protein
MKTYPNNAAFNEITGLTKREYFAAMIISSTWANNEEFASYTTKEYAEFSVKLADALIEELNKDSSPKPSDICPK